MTKLSKKRKLKRARAHAKGIDHRNYGGVSTRSIRKGRFKVVHPDTEQLRVALDYTRATGKPVVVAQQTPTRAKCPRCGFSQKVRKDGTMSRHDVYLGSDAQQCAGTGMQWNAE